MQKLEGRRKSLRYPATCSRSILHTISYMLASYVPLKQTNITAKEVIDTRGSYKYVTIVADTLASTPASRSVLHCLFALASTEKHVFLRSTRIYLSPQYIHR